MVFKEVGKGGLGGSGIGGLEGGEGGDTTLRNTLRTKNLSETLSDSEHSHMMQVTGKLYLIM